MNTRAACFLAALLPLAHCHAEDTGVVHLGYYREKIDMDVHAESLDEAVSQLLAQAWRENNAAPPLTIRIVGEARPGRFDVKLAGTCMLKAVDYIKNFYKPFKAELDKSGAGFVLRKPEPTDSEFGHERHYRLSRAGIDAIGLDLTTRGRIEARLYELGIPVHVGELDAGKRCFSLRGREEALDTFEMLATAVDLTGLDVSSLVPPSRWLRDPLPDLEDFPENPLFHAPPPRQPQDRQSRPDAPEPPSRP